MQVQAQTKQQKIAQLNRLYGEGKLSFMSYHNRLLGLYEKN